MSLVLPEQLTFCLTLMSATFQKLNTLKLLQKRCDPLYCDNCLGSECQNYSSGFDRAFGLESAPNLEADKGNPMTENTSGISAERLRSLIKRIEKLEEDKAAVSEDIKEVYAEAKGTGFDVKIIRQIVRLRKVELEKRREHSELLDLYMSAIGMET